MFHHRVSKLLLLHQAFISVHQSLEEKRSSELCEFIHTADWEPLFHLAPLLTQYITEEGFLF